MFRDDERQRTGRQRFARGGVRFGGRGFHGGDHRGHRGGGRRRGRVFDHGDLRFVILQLIAEKPRHGYEVIKAIEDMLGGAYSPSPGVIYPTLTLLEELGYVTVTTGEGSKKLHTITPGGSAHLQANKASVDSIFGRMAQTRSDHGGGPAPQIIRASENLTFALRLRLSRGPLTEDQIRAIAAALDAAAIEVERS
jgi:DNA-binding PadR family transcriptional regulator